MKFIATAPDGKERESLHVSAFAVDGVLLPLSIRLTTGGTHELEFLLADITYASRATVRLDALMRQGSAGVAQEEEAVFRST